MQTELRGYIGSEAASAVKSLIQSAAKPKEGWIGTVTGFFVLLIGASGVFGQLKDALNTIWEVKLRPERGIWHYLQQRLLSFSMVLVIGFLLLISLLLTAALSALNDRLGQWLGLPFLGEKIRFPVMEHRLPRFFSFFGSTMPQVSCCLAQSLPESIPGSKTNL